MTNIDIDALTIDQVRRDAADSGILRSIRQDIAKIEHELREHDLARASTAAILALADTKAWQDLQKTLLEKEKQAINALCTVDDPRPAVVGRLQAFILAIQSMTRAMTPQALAELDEADTISRRRLAEFQRLLPKRGVR